MSNPQPQQPILFIGGGNMATAIISGLLSSMLYTTDNLYVIDPNLTQLKKLGTDFGLKHLYAPDKTAEVLPLVNTVVLATKPGVVPTLLQNLSPYFNNTHLVISICAGLTTAMLSKAVNKPIAIIRVMPNTPALVNAGVSGICCGEYVTQEQLTLGELIMGAVGSVVVVKESDMNAVTGVSGSGPAYVITFIEALTMGGVKAGLTYPVAYQLALETVYGTAKLLKDSYPQNAAISREAVTSPGGTTVYGLAALKANGFEHAVIECVNAASDRAAAMANL